jgi:hypothetical protein
MYQSPNGDAHIPLNRPRKLKDFTKSSIMQECNQLVEDIKRELKYISKYNETSRKSITFVHRLYLILIHRQDKSNLKTTERDTSISKSF